MFFPASFYADLGLELAPTAAVLEAFFRRQQEIFGDLRCEVGGETRRQYHVLMSGLADTELKVLTFPASDGSGNNPDVQFGALERALEGMDHVAYRAGVLGRLGCLVTPDAKREHRWVKFSYAGLQTPVGLDAGLRALEWLLSEIRCAVAAQSATSRVPAQSHRT